MLRKTFARCWGKRCDNSVLTLELPTRDDFEALHAGVVREAAHMIHCLSHWLHLRKPRYYEIVFVSVANRSRFEKYSRNS